MKKNKIAVGLDIGTTKIVAMIGRENEQGKLEVLGIGRSKSLGVKRGVVNNITQTINSIKQAIEDAQSVSGQTVENVVVGIAGQHIRSLDHSDYITRQKSDTVINQQDIESLIGQVHKLGMEPGKQIIHVLPQEYKIDSQSDIKEPIGMYGARLEANFHVVVGQVSSIRNINRCVNSAGLTLAGITLEPLASALAVLSQEEKEAGVALIDIGGGTTDLAIFKDGVIRHTAVTPFGGNIITQDIKEGCSIIEKQAELLKVKFGSAWPAENTETEIVSIPGLRGREPKEISLKNLSKIIHARANEIIEDVYLQIKKYGHETPKGKLIAGIVLTGGGAQLKHLRELVEYITGMDVRIGYPNEHLSGDSSEILENPEYATAVGLLTEALRKDIKITPVAPKVVAKEQEAKATIISENKIQNKEQKEAFIKEQERKKEQVSKANPSKSKSFFDKCADKFKEFLDNVE